MNKCIFLDRDGVLNKDNPNYAYRVSDFEILPGVIEALNQLKQAGYFLIVVTNQSGISQKIYSTQDMEECHNYLQQECGGIIDHFYFCPYHPSVTASLARKPDTLMFEKAGARFNIDYKTSWMIGDRARDIIPAKKLAIRTIQIDDYGLEIMADFTFTSLKQAANYILSND